MPARPGGLGPTKQRKKAKKKKNRGKSPKVSSVAQDVRNALRQEAAVADIDPEDVDANFDAGFREGPVPRYSHYDESTFAPSGRLHMRAGIDLGDDEKYAGKPASRKDMYSEEENEPEDEESREVLARMRESMQRRAGEAVEFASESDEEVDSEEENEVARELKRIEKEDREALMRLTSSRDEDYKRAVVIKEQVSLWDDFLRMRISMQSLVGNANRFPQPGIYSSFKKDKRRAQPGLKDSVKASIALAEDMLGIQTALIGRNSYIEGNAGAPPREGGGRRRGQARPVVEARPGGHAVVRALLQGGDRQDGRTRPAAVRDEQKRTFGSQPVPSDPNRRHPGQQTEAGEANAAAPTDRRDPWKARAGCGGGTGGIAAGGRRNFRRHGLFPKSAERVRVLQRNRRL